MHTNLRNINSTIMVMLKKHNEKIKTVFNLSFYPVFNLFVKIYLLTLVQLHRERERWRSFTGSELG